MEPNTTFTVTPKSPAKETLGTATTYTYTISSADKPDVIQLSAPAYPVGEAGPNATITATRAGSGSGEVSASFTIVDKTATAGSDYTPPSSPWTLTWGNGDKASKTITVPIVNDPFDEPNETFTVTLADPTGGAVLGSPVFATVTVADNDPPPKVQFDLAASSGAEARASAVLAVSLSAPAILPVVVNYATADGTAKAASGDSAPTSGILKFDPGVTKQTITVSIAGDGDVEPNETFKVALSSPINAVLGRATHTYTIANDDPAGSIQLSSANYSESEGAAKVTITATRVGGGKGQVTVKYATSNGTAKAGSDYTAWKGTLVWDSGDMVDKTFEVPITNDALYELNETFTVKLSGSTGGATLGTPGSGTVTIVENEPIPTVQFEREESSGSESTATLVLAVGLSAPSSLKSTVKYATAAGTALAGVDYKPTSGTLTFSPGQTSTTISVPIVNDKAPEVPGNETFTVSLSGPVNAVLGDLAQHTYTINDEDRFGAIKLSAAAYSIGEGGPWVTIIAQRLGGDDGEVSVSCTTSDGTATGDDYTAAPVPLTWLAGDMTNKTFTIPITDDTLDELNETFKVTLLPPTGGAVLGSPSEATVTISDNDPAPSVWFSSAASSGSESATTAEIEVMLSAPSANQVTVNYATANGTAKAASDYMAVSGTLKFAPGDLSTTIEVPILDDATAEPDETFTVTLTSPVNAVLGTPSRHVHTLVVGETTVEEIRLNLLAVLVKHPELDDEVPRGPAAYQKIADELAQVPGVEAADYSGDTLGTYYVKVRGGGILSYRHVTNDTEETLTLPAGVTHSGLRDPVYNADWGAAVSVPAVASNSYADHFPVASINPDPDYLADDAVECRPEGKIAIVDFYYTTMHHEEHKLYENAFLVDGVEIWDRIRMLAEAAGFTVDFYKDDEINAGNFTKLQDYTMVITNGHGGRPGPKTFKSVGFAVTTLVTEEKYDPKAVTAKGITYFDAWKRGQIHYNIKTLAISWTPLLLRDGFRPTVPQQWLMSQCWSLLPFWVGYYEDDNGWHYSVNLAGEVYNFGDALMDAGVQVVFGYIDPAYHIAIPPNLMKYLRRTFGAYSKKDVPPARFGLSYWPTCMSAQTFFRLPSTPEISGVYAPKLTSNSTFTMYAQPEPKEWYLRAACSDYRFPHAAMQNFVLSVGTPATAFPSCWDNYWSTGDYPSCLVDPLCCQGNSASFYQTQQAAQDAACQVKIARKVTNAILESP